MTVSLGVNLVAAIFGLMAAYFWFRSARHKPNPEELVVRLDAGKRIIAEWERYLGLISGDNSKGAIFAGLSASLSAIAQFFQ